MGAPVTTRARTMMTPRIHCAPCPPADLDRVGSITVDAALLEAADPLPDEGAGIRDGANGDRLLTNVIPGERGSGQIRVNGADAHLVSPGDAVILIAYGRMSDGEARATSRGALLHAQPRDTSFAPAAKRCNLAE